MLKILQARLQHYVNREILGVQAAFRKGRGTRDQIANICWIIEKARELQKNVSVQFSCSAVSDSLRPHELQHARPPCPLPAPGVYSNSCPLSQWCHPSISSSVVPFFSHLQSFPASGSFQMSPFFVSGCQSIGVSASASVLPMNIQDWFLLELTCWISEESSLTPQFKKLLILLHQSLWLCASQQTVENS